MKNKFLKDQLTEESGGKYSSKKFWGAIIMTLVCTAFVLDGLKFYTANHDLFNSMLIAGCTLLGLTIAKSVFNKTEKPKNE
jgi:uncharacterized membrane protein YwaF